MIVFIVYLNNVCLEIGFVKDYYELMYIKIVCYILVI